MSEHPQSDQCFICGQQNAHTLEEHHAVPQRLNGSDSQENLYFLCGSCHNAVEQIYDDDFYKRLDISIGEIGQESQIDLDDGKIVEPNESLDREIPKESPHIQVEQQPVNGEDAKTTKESSDTGSTCAIDGGEDYPKAYRIHCSYCRVVYGQDQHPDMARHLRLRHGIDKPYNPQLDWNFNSEKQSDILTRPNRGNPL